MKLANDLKEQQGNRVRELRVRQGELEQVVARLQLEAEGLRAEIKGMRDRHKEEIANQDAELKLVED